MAGVATLQEIKTQWTIDDLADANEILDYKEEMAFKEQEEFKRQMDRARR